MSAVETPKYDLTDATAKADAELQKIGTTVVSITAGVASLAGIVVGVRKMIERSITSKKTGKAVTVPDWDGRSPEYRDWYRDILTPLIDKRIPEDFRGTIRTRLQNQVQEQAHKAATPAQKAHLGMAPKSKATTQQEKRQAAKTGANASSAPRDTDEAFSVDSLVAFAKEGPAEEVAQTIAAMCEAFAGRVRKSDFDMPKAGAKRSSDFLKQSLSHLMTTRAGLDTLSGVGTKEKVAA